MAYFPVNARSEFTSLRSPGVLGLMNFSDGGVFDTSRRFQLASPALNQPAWRPTRGSGVGGVVDMLYVRDDVAHAATQRKLPRTRTGGFMAGSVEGVSPASCSCGRFPSSGPRSRPMRT